MSRAGCPRDNAMAESFMRTLKREEVDGRVYRDLEDARALIGTFLEEVYYRQRMHSALAYLAPEAYEASQQGWLNECVAYFRVSRMGCSPCGCRLPRRKAAPRNDNQATLDFHSGRVGPGPVWASQ
jgi:hypothetical protein